MQRAKRQRGAERPSSLGLCRERELRTERNAIRSLEPQAARPRGAWDYNLCSLTEGEENLKQVSAHPRNPHSALCASFLICKLCVAGFFIFFFCRKIGNTEVILNHNEIE